MEKGGDICQPWDSSLLSSTPFSGPQQCNNWSERHFISTGPQEGSQPCQRPTTLTAGAVPLSAKAFLSSEAPGGEVTGLGHLQGRPGLAHAWPQQLVTLPYAGPPPRKGVLGHSFYAPGWK